jgi:hypothetical protein
VNLMATSAQTLTRAEVAALDLHESTVRRTIVDKQALLPGGTMLPLARFFGVSGGLGSELRSFSSRPTVRYPTRTSPNGCAAGQWSPGGRGPSIGHVWASLSTSSVDTPVPVGPHRGDVRSRELAVEVVCDHRPGWIRAVSGARTSERRTPMSSAVDRSPAERRSRRGLDRTVVAPWHGGTRRRHGDCRLT